MDTRRPFELGRLCATPGILESLEPSEVLHALQRHSRGDWGDVGEEDRKENERSLTIAMRLFSVYHSAKGQKFWIITEADRSLTTVLLPEEY